MSFDPLDVYDHEVDAIDRVLKALNVKAQAKQLNYTDFEREIKERFAEIGLIVKVDWYEFGIGDRPGAVPGAVMPEITPIGRTESGFVFDHDRQVHEVTHNILGLPGQEGVIKTNTPGMKRLTEGHKPGH